MKTVAIRAAPSVAPAEYVAALAMKTCKPLVDAASAEAFLRYGEREPRRLSPEPKQVSERLRWSWAYQSTPRLLEAFAVGDVVTERKRLGFVSE